MSCDKDGSSPSPSSSPGIAAEEERLRRRRSTLGGRSCRSIGGRLSLAAPPHPALHDQVLQIDEGQPWDTKLSHLLDIALREAMRRLEARLPGDECVPELRAAVFTEAGAMSLELAKHACCLTPVATAAAAEHSSFPTRANVEKYKEKTEKLENEYNKWKALRRQREADYRTAEMEFQEARSMVTTVDDGQEVHLTPAQRSILDSWSDCSSYIEETQQAREKSQLALQEVKHITEVVNGLLTASRLQAESSYTALEKLNNAHLKTQSLSLIMNSVMKQHLAKLSSADEA